MKNNRVLGTIAECNVRCDLSYKGYIVSDNDECDKSDLTCKSYINDGNSPSRHFSVQVKCANDISYRINLITSSGSGDNRTFSKYKRGDFDIFAIDFKRNFGKVIYVPLELVMKQADETLNIRILPPHQNNKPYWSAWDFLSVEKCLNSPFDYRMRNDGNDEDTDSKFVYESKNLEKHIQYKWLAYKEANEYENEFSSYIMHELCSYEQFPPWFKAQYIGNQIWSQFGEEPNVDILDKRKSNSTKIRKDLKVIITPQTQETLSQFI